MKDIYLYNISSEEKKNFVFWSEGDGPIQKDEDLNYEKVLLSFKALYLLANKIVASASFYFESDLTRRVTKEMNNVFRSGEAMFFIEENLENFSEHGLYKMSKSPPSMEAYNNREKVLTLGGELDNCGLILRRRSLQITERIIEYWMEDLFSKESNSLGCYIEMNVYKPHDIKIKLAKIAIDCKSDFVWDYVKNQIYELNINVPKGFHQFARMRLNDFYVLSTADIIKINIDRSIMSHITRYDTNLFIHTLDIINILEAFKQVNIHAALGSTINETMCFLLLCEKLFCRMI